MIHTTDQVDGSYAALLTGDERTAEQHCAEHVTCHIGGQHPFSGDYHGVAAITGVLRSMDQAAGTHSFSVTNVMSDDSGSQVLVEGVATHGTYARHVMNRLRYVDGRLAELWIKPLDQRAEDDFWRGLVPQQRAAQSAPARDDADTGGS